MKFKIRDSETNEVFFEIEKDEDEEDLEDNIEELLKSEDFDEKEYRTIKYNFGSEFF